ncbi:phosphodiesterase [Pseudodesulfovibrio hydrargyri]|uniref:Phosphodiesterase n=1 Tax=Pseudodesulfovibrio hydrargyri TaxID=2125990 RepID=A0A1J5MWF4_9BACT|nr:metallophosphoesterase family protein [Pseudodesulfovibrio hydrargyri]OIQ50298.1 phosphodiesterase [Pseudodesulfovibrio hydrargyri]
MKSQEPLAVLADIHGNAAALKAVLAHAKAHGLTRFVNLGDTFYGPLDPAGTWAVLAKHPMPTVLGNQDRILLDDAPPPAVDAVRGLLGPAPLAWLAGLPGTLRLEPDILLCHGTPKDDAAYLLEDVATGLPAPREPGAVLADLLPEAEGCTLVLAGHSHHAGLALAGGMTVINPGSVGLPAYNDDDPPHAMASGSPRAAYAVVSRTASGWDAEFVEVDYDWESAAALARENGRGDWARWLSTGLA